MDHGDFWSLLRWAIRISCCLWDIFIIMFRAAPQQGAVCCFVHMMIILLLKGGMHSLLRTMIIGIQLKLGQKKWRIRPSLTCMAVRSLFTVLTVLISFRARRIQMMKWFG